MKHVEKNRLSKKRLYAIAFSLVFVIALAVTIPVGIALTNKKTEQVISTPPAILDGEARQGLSTLAYPIIDDMKQFTFVGVKNPQAEFGFLKQSGEKHLTMYYVDSSTGDTKLYFPDIFYEDATVDYEDFYMTDMSSQYGMTFLRLLCVGIQLSYFNERIPLSSDAAERESQIAIYGLDEDVSTVINFEYLDIMGEKVSHKIRIGSKNVVGNGYYFMVDDREYVYSSNNNYYDHAVSDYERFIKPLLVSKGLDSDKGYGPYLTTDYKQWNNEIHDTDGEKVDEDSRVIIYADTISLVKNKEDADGYDNTGYRSFEINLADIKNNKNYSRLFAALSNASIGVQTPELVFSVSSYSNIIDFGENQSVKYSYLINEIEAILTDSGEISKVGAAVGENNLIKVAYTVRFKDGDVSSLRHAVIDLTKLSQADAAKLRALSVGKLNSGAEVSIDIEYTKENSVLVNDKYKITEIISVKDPAGKKQDLASSTSTVTYRYVIETDGVERYEGIGVLNLGKEEKTAVEETIASLLINRGVSRNISMQFNSVDSHFEYFQDFVTYKVKEIEYFVTRDIVVAFRFQNSSDRDPYYGESFYENIMDDEHKLYGLNASACEEVVKILGGLSEESTTATAAGLAGEEVVAIGLTPDVMEKYKLYAHTIYFELPRIVYEYDASSSSNSLNMNLSDYGCYDRIGFTLHISEVDPQTNKRYIASDMYDIVTTMPAEALDFLSYDFETLWARRNMIFMSTVDIDDLKIEFNMADLKGEYLFNLTHKIVNYETSANGELAEFQKTTVFVEPSGECTPNKLLDVIAQKGYTGISLEELYKNVYPNDEEAKKVYPDSVGTSYFKDLLTMVSLTTYVDVMPEEDRASAKKEENLLMRMTLKVVATKNASPYNYVYEFYRADDRRVLLSIYQTDLEGKIVTNAVSDFYLSTFAFKKLVNNFVGILNAEKITPDVGYPDEK